MHRLRDGNFYGHALRADGAVSSRHCQGTYQARHALTVRCSSVCEQKHRRSAVSEALTQAPDAGVNAGHQEEEPLFRQEFRRGGRCVNSHADMSNPNSVTEL